MNHQDNITDENNQSLPLDESLLSAYLDGELTDSERELVEKELRSNPAWQSILNDLNRVRSILVSLPKPSDRHSIVGPWQTTPVAPVPQTAATSNWRIAPLLSLAALLAVVAFGTYFSMRLDNKNNQIAWVAPDNQTNLDAAKQASGFVQSPAPGSNLPAKPLETVSTFDMPAPDNDAPTARQFENGNATWALQSNRSGFDKNKSIPEAKKSEMAKSLADPQPPSPPEALNAPFPAERLEMKANRQAGAEVRNRDFHMDISNQDNFTRLQNLFFSEPSDALAAQSTDFALSKTQNDLEFSIDPKPIPTYIFSVTPSPTNNLQLAHRGMLRADANSIKEIDSELADRKDETIAPASPSSAAKDNAQAAAEPLARRFQEPSDSPASNVASNMMNNDAKEMRISNQLHLTLPRNQIGEKIAVLNSNGFIVNPANHFNYNLPVPSQEAQLSYFGANHGGLGGLVGGGQGNATEFESMLQSPTSNRRPPPLIPDPESPDDMVHVILDLEDSQ